MQFDFKIKSIQIYLENNSNDDHTNITIFSTQLNELDEFTWFTVVIKFWIKQLSDNIDIVFSVFQQQNSRIKLIKIKNLESLIQNESKLLSLINAEDTLIYYESSIQKNNTTAHLPFIGIEFRTKTKLPQKFFSDFIKIRIIKELGIKDDFF